MTPFDPSLPRRILSILSDRVDDARYIHRDWWRFPFWMLVFVVNIVVIAILAYLSAHP